MALIETRGVFSPGRPRAARAKVLQTLRLDPDVVAHFNAAGPGWRTRINAALRKAAGLA